MVMLLCSNSACLISACNDTFKNEPYNREPAYFRVTATSNSDTARYALAGQSSWKAAQVSAQDW